MLICFDGTAPEKRSWFSHLLASFLFAGCTGSWCVCLLGASKTRPGLQACVKTAGTARANVCYTRDEVHWCH